MRGSARVVYGIIKDIGSASRNAWPSQGEKSCNRDRPRDPRIEESKSPHDGLPKHWLYLKFPFAGHCYETA
jgi:hypothetical protein